MQVCLFVDFSKVDLFKDTKCMNNESSSQNSCGRKITANRLKAVHWRNCFHRTSQQQVQHLIYVLLTTCRSDKAQSGFGGRSNERYKVLFPGETLHGWNLQDQMEQGHRHWDQFWEIQEHHLLSIPEVSISPCRVQLQTRGMVSLPFFPFPKQTFPCSKSFKQLQPTPVVDLIWQSKNWPALHQLTPFSTHVPSTAVCSWHDQNSWFHAYVKLVLSLLIE